MRPLDTTRELTLITDWGETIVIPPGKWYLVQVGITFLYPRTEQGFRNPRMIRRFIPWARVREAWQYLPQDV